MRGLVAIAAVVLVTLSSACSGGDAGSGLTDVTGTGASLLPGAAAATCPAGTQACGGSGFCCPTGTTCLANPNDVLGCGAEYCCAGCTSGTACGTGCCATGTYCSGNPGGAAGCGTSLCCSPVPEQAPCPPGVEAECPAGTRCLANRSARYCPGGYACYLASGAIGCPGETMCPNGLDFCPEDTYCAAHAGVCPVGSSSGNYCCRSYAQIGDSCDTTLCAPGLSCVTNPNCAGGDPTALKTCKGSCAGQMDCGTYCCDLGTTDFCGPPDSCLCYYWIP